MRCGSCKNATVYTCPRCGSIGCDNKRCGSRLYDGNLLRTCLKCGSVGKQIWTGTARTPGTDGAGVSDLACLKGCMLLVLLPFRVLAAVGLIRTRPSRTDKSIAVVILLVLIVGVAIAVRNAGPIATLGPKDGSGSGATPVRPHGSSSAPTPHGSGPEATAALVEWTRPGVTSQEFVLLYRVAGDSFSDVSDLKALERGDPPAYQKLLARALQSESEVAEAVTAIKAKVEESATLLAQHKALMERQAALKKDTATPFEALSDIRLELSKLDYTFKNSGSAAKSAIRAVQGKFANLKNSDLSEAEAAIDRDSKQYTEQSRIK